MNKAEVEESLKIVAEAADIFCVSFSPASLNTFRDSLKNALRLQAAKPGSPLFELARSVWLDIFRWAVAYRIAVVRKPQHSFLSPLRNLLVTDPRLNPYCNFCIAFGKGCEGCPLTVYNVVRWRAPVLHAAGIENSYLKCALRHPHYIALQEAFQTTGSVLFGNVAKLIKRIVNSGIDAVRLWDKVWDSSRGCYRIRKVTGGTQ